MPVIHPQESIRGDLHRFHTGARHPLSVPRPAAGNAAFLSLDVITAESVAKI